MTTYGTQMDRKFLPSVRHSICLSVQKWTGSVCLSVRPKHFPYLLDEPYARELQAQGACALRFFCYIISTVQNPIFWKLFSNIFREFQLHRIGIWRCRYQFQSQNNKEPHFSTFKFLQIAKGHSGKAPLGGGIGSIRKPPKNYSDFSGNSKLLKIY